MANIKQKIQIDLNADVGEIEDGIDEALMPLISSANIACGWHAGNAAMMQQCVTWAIRNNVAIGAHPAFFDRENFGRNEMQIPAQEIYAGVLYQVGALAAIAAAQGARLSHVKPHGALYNMAARDAVISDAIVAAIRDFDPSLAVFGLAGSATIAAAQRAGLTAVEEVFADRGYNADGSLVQRGTPGALIDDEERALEQTLHLVRDGKVHAIDGSWVNVNAGTVCLHGDGAHALEFAGAIRSRLENEGIQISAQRGETG